MLSTAFRRSHSTGNLLSFKSPISAIGSGSSREPIKLGKMYGTKPGFYLLAGPNWTGSAPAGITEVFRSPTNTAFVFPRAFVDDTPADKQALQQVINRIGVYPLSQFDGKEKVKDRKKMPNYPATAGGSGETKWVDPDTFFDLLPTLLDEVPPLPGQVPLAWPAATDPWVGSPASS